MGTKVQCNSYLPGYYTMRNPNDDGNNGRWSQYYDDKTLNSGPYYNCFLPRPTADGYFGFDKEVLKQTMIEHETIFRSQVCELHRVYKIQRDLMYELRRKELHQHPIQVEPSQSSPFLSQMPSEEAQLMWHIPSLPLVNSTCSKPYVSGADSMRSPLSFVKGDSMPTQNGGRAKDSELDSKSKKCRRRMFDLQLPADEYIDSEEEQFEEEKVSEGSLGAGYPPRRSYVLAPERDTKPSLGSGNPSFQGDASISGSCLQSPNGLADLNEPILVEEAASSAPVDFLAPCHREIQGQDLHAKPNPDFLGFPREFFQNTQKGRDNATCTYTGCLENKGKQQEWLSYNLEAGQSRTSLNSFPQGFCPERLPTPLEPVQVDLKKVHDLPAFLLSDQSKRERWRERGLNGLEISSKNHDLSNYNHPGSVVVPQSDGVNSGSPSVSSWRKSSSQSPVAVQALPLTKSSNLLIQSPDLFGDKSHLNRNSRSHTSFGSEISYHNGFCHGSQSESKSLQVCFPSVGSDYLNCISDHNSTTENVEKPGPTKYCKGSDCMDVKAAKDVNLNFVLPNGFQDRAVSQQDLVIIDRKGKHEDLPGGLPWLRAKPSCDNRPTKGSGSFTQTGSSFLQTLSHQLSNKVETENGPSSSFIQDSTSTSWACDTEPKKIDVDDCPSNKKILGFLIFDEPHISKDHSSSVSFSSKSHCYPSEVKGIDNREKVGGLHIDLSNYPALPTSEKQLSTENLVVEKGVGNAFRNHINLNACINEEESLPIPFAPRATVKITVEIDLEAPVLLEEEVIPHGRESSGNQPETTIRLLEHKDKDLLEEHVRTAAEAIVSISSSSIHNPLADATCHPQEASLSDSLYWFADVVSSTMGDLNNDVGVALRGKGGEDHEETSSDIDYFESMTLKLKETEVEEYWCKPQAPENQEEETGVTSLVSRPRKGRVRRGRQRKDFQRDILPGLVSLSRQDVNEDLQAFGGLMRATGFPWQTGLTKRNGARNGCARGRSRLRGRVTITTTRTVPSPPIQQPNNNELGLDELNLTGWGKTTRRPRRQRCPASNLSLQTLTQV